MLLRNFSLKNLFESNLGLLLAPRLFSLPSDIEHEVNCENENGNKKIRRQESVRKYNLKNKEKKREYYLKNKEKLKETNRDYYLKNKEKVQESNREYRLKNEEKMKKYRREYYLNNKDKKLEYHRVYNVKNKEKKREYHMKNKERLREINREYKLKNKEKLQDSMREYYLKNKERLKESNRKNRLKNKDKLQESSREYYLKNKERKLGSSRQYRLKNKEKKRQYYLKNKEKKQDSNREYKLMNKEKMKDYHLKYRLKNKDKRQAYHREYSLKNSKKLLEKYIRKNKMKNENYVFKKKLLFWSDKMSVRNLFDKAAELLYISNPSDWYRISNSQIIKVLGAALFRRFRTLGDALNFAYPEHSWDVSKFNLRGKKSNQRWLLVQLRLLMPNETIIEDYNHPSLLWDSDRPAQIDIFVPRINLGLEYQGEQHFRELYAYGSGSALGEIVKRDQEKKDMCEKNGITLVYVPYWWDGTNKSLSSTLAQYLPNSFSITDSPPIPTNLPPGFKKLKRKRNTVEL